MGRGRQKAKQTKVARELKYSVPSSDLSALARELSGGKSSPAPLPVPVVEEEEDDFSDIAAKYNVEDETD